MSYKNTMRLIASNFALVWKQALYFLLCFVLFVICTYEVSKPLIMLLKENGIFGEVNDTINSVYAFRANIFISFLETIKHILNLIAMNFGSIYGSLILFFIFGMLLPYIFFQISIYNLSSIIYKKLSMNMNVRYIQNLIGSLKPSIKYALTNIVLGLPFWAIKILVFEIFLSISNTTFGTYIGMFMMVTIFVIVDSIRKTFFASYTGLSVEKDNASPITFGNSVPLTIKNFWNGLASSVIVELTIVASNCFICLFTFFSGAFVIIPASFVFVSIFYIVIYFNKSGQRYYLGNNYIFNPIKYTVKQDEYALKNSTPEEPIDEQINNLTKNK